MTITIERYTCTTFVLVVQKYEKFVYVNIPEG